MGAVLIGCHVLNTEVPMGRLWHLKVNPATSWEFQTETLPDGLRTASIGKHPCHVAHLAAGSALAFAVKVHRDTGLP